MFTVPILLRCRRSSSHPDFETISARSYTFFPAALRNGNRDHRCGFLSGARDETPSITRKRTQATLTDSLREIGSTILGSRARTPRTSRARTHVRRPVARSGVTLISSSTLSAAGLKSRAIQSCPMKCLCSLSKSAPAGRRTTPTTSFRSLSSSEVVRQRPTHSRELPLVSGRRT